MDRPPQTNPLGSALQPSALVSTPLGSATPGRIPRTGPSIGSLGPAPSFGILGSALPSLTPRLCPRGSSHLQTGPLESASSRWALSLRTTPARNGTLGSAFLGLAPLETAQPTDHSSGYSASAHIAQLTWREALGSAHTPPVGTTVGAPVGVPVGASVVAPVGAPLIIPLSARPPRRCDTSALRRISYLPPRRPP